MKIFTTLALISLPALAVAENLPEFSSDGNHSFSDYSFSDAIKFSNENQKDRSLMRDESLSEMVQRANRSSGDLVTDIDPVSAMIVEQRNCGFNDDGKILQDIFVIADDHLKSPEIVFIIANGMADAFRDSFDDEGIEAFCEERRSEAE